MALEKKGVLLPGVFAFADWTGVFVGLEAVEAVGFGCWWGELR